MKTSALNDAIALARAAHSGQTDKVGQDYINHPLRVSEGLAGAGEALQVAAVLHDVVEDCGVKPHEIRARFGSDVACLVDAVTRRDNETYSEFIDRIVVAGRADDIADNLSRLDNLTETEAESLGRRYRKALSVLSAAEVVS